MELNLQLNTKSDYNRDMVVELTNQATGQIKTVKPFLDGKVVARNIDAGQWRAVVKHPNLLFPLYDRPLKVLPNRPTFVPVVIPDTIFENSAIADTPDADLGPTQDKFSAAVSAANVQANKLAGQPIYADDWNTLSGTVADLAQSNLDLSNLVSPLGHDHPEIADKINEVQANLQRFYDLFGRSLAQLQRQVQQLALQRKVDAALGEVGSVTDSQRGAIDAAIGDIAVAWADQPSVYSMKKRRTGQQLSQTLADIVAGSDDGLESNPTFVAALDVATALAGEQPASDYTKEIENQQRFEQRSGSAPFSDALTGHRFTFGG